MHLSVVCKQVYCPQVALECLFFFFLKKKSLLLVINFFKSIIVKVELLNSSK
jgi:hypothetical protein